MNYLARSIHTYMYIDVCECFFFAVHCLIVQCFPVLDLRGDRMLEIRVSGLGC